MRGLILRTTTRVLMPVVIVLSVFFLWRGHDEPGGGFIAGLIAGAGVILRYLATGSDGVRRMIPVRSPVLLGSGLGLAVLVGLGGLVFGDAFLEGAVWRPSVPVLGEIKLAASLGFDVGVYLIVVGMVVALIRTFGEEPR